MSLSLLITYSYKNPLKPVCILSTNCEHRSISIFHSNKNIFTMATITSLLIIVLAFMLSGEATAQSSCTGTLLTLSSCLNFVTGNTSTPSTTCCSSLGSVVQSQPRCLCSLLNGGGGSSLGISINQTLAMALPALCNVQTPPVSQCNGKYTFIYIYIYKSSELINDEYF